MGGVTKNAYVKKAYPAKTEQAFCQLNYNNMT